MNYRHIYHAGNICDVVKHSVLALVLNHLCAKDTPFAVIDTHAGIGLYDLADERALRTHEAESGVQKLLTSPTAQETTSYIDLIKKFNACQGNPGPLRFYPGSPLLIAKMMRSQDRLVACEMHEEDAPVLRRSLRNTPQAHVHHRDGYEALRAFLPPLEKRGLVLIDPPYEDAAEFQKLPGIIADAYRRWPTGIFLLWYPVKDRPTLWQFHEAMIAASIPKMLCAEFIYNDETRNDRLNGSGLILINPPWQMTEKIAALFPALHKALGTKTHGDVVRFLTA